MECSCAGPELPCSTLIRDAEERLPLDNVLFGGMNTMDDTPSLYYSSVCRNPAAGDPLLQRIEAVHLTRGIFVLPKPGHLDPQRLRGVHTLVLIRVSGSDEEEEEALEEWIVSRHEDGRPLNLVEFRKCRQGAMEMYERLAAAGTCKKVSW